MQPLEVALCLLGAAALCLLLGALIGVLFGEELRAVGRRRVLNAEVLADPFAEIGGKPYLDIDYTTGAHPPEDAQEQSKALSGPPLPAPSKPGKRSRRNKRRH